MTFRRRFPTFVILTWFFPKKTCICPKNSICWTIWEFLIKNTNRKAVWKKYNTFRGFEEYQGILSKKISKKNSKFWKFWKFSSTILIRDALLMKSAMFRTSEVFKDFLRKTDLFFQENPSFDVFKNFLAFLPFKTRCWENLPILVTLKIFNDFLEKKQSIFPKKHQALNALRKLEQKQQLKRVLDKIGHV